MELGEIKCQIWLGKKMLATVTMHRFLLCGVERGFPEDFSSGFHGREGRARVVNGWWQPQRGNRWYCLMIHQHGTLNHKTQPVLYLMLQIKNEIGYYIPIAERSYARLPYLQPCKSYTSASSSTVQYVHLVACHWQCQPCKVVNLSVHLTPF